MKVFQMRNLNLMVTKKRPDEIEINMVVVLLCLLERGLFVKELVTSNCVFQNAFVLNLQYQKAGGFVSVYTDLQILVTFQYFLKNYQSC